MSGGPKGVKWRHLVDEYDTGVDGDASYMKLISWGTASTTLVTGGENRGNMHHLPPRLPTRVFT